MDPVERAEILFAQLDVLLAGGQLEAARELSGRLRDHMHEHRIASAPAASLRHDERAAVLEPLATMLRQQRALARDVRDAHRAAQEAAAQHTEPLDPSRLGELLSRGAEDIQAALEGIAERLDPMAAERLSTAAGRGVARLRKAVRSGRMSPVRDALDDLRTRVFELGPEALGDSHLGQLMHDFVARLDPTGMRAITEALTDRQGGLLSQVAPIPPGASPTGDDANVLRKALPLLSPSYAALSASAGRPNEF